MAVIKTWYIVLDHPVVFTNEHIKCCNIKLDLSHTHANARKRAHVRLYAYDMPILNIVALQPNVQMAAVQHSFS